MHGAYKELDCQEQYWQEGCVTQPAESQVTKLFPMLAGITFFLIQYILKSLVISDLDQSAKQFKSLS